MSKTTSYIMNRNVRKQNMTPGRSCTDLVGCILSWLVGFVCQAEPRNFGVILPRSLQVEPGNEPHQTGNQRR